MTVRIHARLSSLGGIILFSILFVVLILLIIAYFFSTDLLITKLILWVALAALVIYLLESWKETLIIEDNILSLISLFRHPAPINTTVLRDVRLVHEGLNLELGIESIVCCLPDGREERLALGPLWRKRDLEWFMETITQRTKKEN